ncbi:Bacteriohemerythrin [Patescibacteria group bacterium]|nr:Bacteriohemerythrin [Patescibacteria group bacterium]
MAEKHFVEWSDHLSVGIEEIDAQHKMLVALINRLYDETIVHKADLKVLDEILNELVEYTIIHFAVEESLFRIFDYPASETHTQHHNQLKEQVMELQKKFRNGQLTVNTELLLFLKNWLQHHILEEDKLYSPFLLEQGVKSHSPQSASWFSRFFHK